MISQSLWLLVANPTVGSNKPGSLRPTQGPLGLYAKSRLVAILGIDQSKWSWQLRLQGHWQNFHDLAKGKWRFPEMGVPQDGFSWKIPFTWMILGYPHLRKPPNRDGKFKKTTETSLKHAGHAEHCRQSCRVASRWITFPQTWSCKKQLCSLNGCPWDLKPWSLVFGFV